MIHHENVGNPVAVVAAINEQRGCPVALPPAAEMGTCPVDQMTPDERKQEYYFLLDGVLESVMENVRGFREQFPMGLVERDETGAIVSSLPRLQEQVRPLIAAGNFADATYWAHNALYTSIDLATEKWLAETDKDATSYQRVNSLVDDDRQAAYGGIAVQKRVASAANQTVLISCSLQRMTALHGSSALGRPMTPREMSEAHDKNVRFAMPMTNLHLYETRPIRKVLGAEKLPGGEVEVYSNPEYFVFAEGGLYPNGTEMVQAMAAFKDTFPDGRIGCPGNKYVPEIWAWAAEVSNAHALPALAPSEYTFTAPSVLPKVK